MTILVVGANGQIGRQFCQLAQDTAVPFRAMVRSTEQQAWFRERGMDTVLADLEGDLDHAFDGCDQVLFTAGSGPHTGADKTLLIDLHGAMRVADLAKSKGLSRYIMVSALRADDPLRAPEKLRPYMAAKKAADDYLKNRGAPYVILKPGRLTDDPATGRVATSVEEAGDNIVSRANVAVALLYLVRTPSLVNREFGLLDGTKTPEEALV